MNTASTSTSLLQNKRAVIFGAGGAVGTAVAKEFASQGATVFLSGRKLAAIEKVAQEIRQDGGVAYAAEVDALDEQAVNAYLEERGVQEGESIDILLNAMGPQAKDYGNGTSTHRIQEDINAFPLLYYALLKVGVHCLLIKRVHLRSVGHAPVLANLLSHFLNSGKLPTLQEDPGSLRRELFSHCRSNGTTCSKDD